MLYLQLIHLQNQEPLVWKSISRMMPVVIFVVEIYILILGLVKQVVSAFVNLLTIQSMKIVESILGDTWMQLFPKNLYRSVCFFLIPNYFPPLLCALSWSGWLSRKYLLFVMQHKTCSHQKYFEGFYVCLSWINNNKYTLFLIISLITIHETY